MRAALKNGANFWNGGEFYGTPNYNSPVLLARYFDKYPEDAGKVVLSIKGSAGPNLEGIDGRATEVRRSLDTVLAQLQGRKKLDLFECARRDPRVPLRETFGVLQEYIDAGKLGGISLSEVSAATINEAVSIAKVCAVEVELSLFSTEVLENGVAAACAQHGIPLVAYSPLCRGLLTGTFRTPADLPEADIRMRYPRFAGDNFKHNLTLVERVVELAEQKEITPAQFALAWVRTLQKRPGMPTIIPIPGATTAERVDENCMLIELTDGDMKEIDAILDKMEVKGTRYPAGMATNT